MTETDDLIRRRYARAGLVCVLLVVLGVWLRSLWGEFVYDDNLLIKRNPALTSLAHLPSILSNGMWSFLDADEAQHLGYWRPLAGIVLLFTNLLGHGSPFAFHAVMIALHLIATAAAYVLASQLTRSAPVALFAALLFGLHPVHVESVAWISALNDPLSAIFTFATLSSWIRWREQGSRGKPWLAAALLSLALVSKEAGLGAVLLAGLYDLLREPRAGDPPRRIGRLWQGGFAAWLPFAIVIVVWYLARVAVFEDPLAGLSRTTTWFGVGPARLAALRLELIGGFTWLGLWPVHLALFHPFRPELSGSDPEFLRALACTAGLAAGIWYACKRGLSALAFALCFMPLALAPALWRVEALAISPLAERYLYFGVFGIVLAIAWCAWRYLPHALATIALLTVAALYSVRTVDRIGVWHDEVKLYQTTLAESPKVPQSYWVLGRLLLERYRITNSVEDLREATRMFFRCLDLLESVQKGDTSIFATSNDFVQTNLGVAWCLLYDAEASPDHDSAAARNAFEAIAAKYPDSSQAQVGLAAVALLEGRLPDAEAALKKSLERNERNVEAHHNLGIVLVRSGKLADAQRSFERALVLRPEHLDDQLWMARIALLQGTEVEARAWLTKARAAHPRSTAPLVIEATLAAQKSHIDEALELVGQALDQEPDDGEALALKAKLHLKRGEKNSAAQALTRACELLPTNFEVNYNMGALMLERSVEGALPYLLRAYALRPADETGATLRRTMTQLTFRAAKAPCELAVADLARGDLQGASEWAAKALAVDPKSGEVHLLLGNLFQRRGENDAAEREFRTAAQLSPEDPEIQLTLARQLVEHAKPAEAAKVLEQLLELLQRKGAGSVEDELTRRTAREMLEEIRSPAPR